MEKEKPLEGDDARDNSSRRHHIQPGRIIHPPATMGADLAAMRDEAAGTANPAQPLSPPVADTPSPSVPPSPAPVVGASMPFPSAPQTPVAPHSANAGTIILQWLTYAFWGWTVLALAILTVSVFQRLLAGSDVSTYNYYVIAALVVLLPISFGCDMVYSKTELDKKVGASLFVMVVHAVIFALFTISALLFVAWSVVSLATNHSYSSITLAGLFGALLISAFYAITFLRTLNPAHILWIPKVYRFTMVGLFVVFAILGFTKPTFYSAPAANCNPSRIYMGVNSSSTCSTQPSPSTPSNTFSNGKLEPTAIGGTQCDNPTLPDGSTTGQMAVSGGATCSDADSVIQGGNDKNGANYSADGYNCTGTQQGSNTQWSSYWNNDFYTYSCANGSKQAAFNLQTPAQNSASSTTTD
ncbi:MAG TPA: hypothetical protein VMR75_01610 [Candidatus Saccharimonadales bacterium]|nr:hypothetical protein [Candidatus Saccharimonadales bacterium]